MPFSTPMLDEHARDGEPEPLGARLRALRESKGQSIDDVVEATNIPADKIEAIESGAIIGSAPRAYARGFVRLYVEHLEMDVEAVMAEFDGLCHPERAKLFLRGLGPMSHKDYRPSRRHQDRRAVRAVLWVLLVLAALTLAYYGWGRVNHWLRSMEEQPPVTPAEGTDDGDSTRVDGTPGDGTGSGIDAPAYVLDIVAIENAPYKVEIDGGLIVADQILPKGESYPAAGYKSVRTTLREPAKVRVFKDGAEIELNLGTEPVVLIYDENGLRTEPADGNPSDEAPADADPAGDGPGGPSTDEKEPADPDETDTPDTE